jgi:hypothetical protein
MCLRVPFSRIALSNVVGPPGARLIEGPAVDFVVESDRARPSGIARRVRDGRVRANIGYVPTLDEAVATLNARSLNA